MVFFSHLFKAGGRYRVPSTASAPAFHLTPAAVPPQSRERPLALLPDDELEALPSLGYIVPQIIPAGGFVTVVGASGSGKTFLVLDIAMSIATGKPWHGVPVTRGPVVYVAGEGVRGLAARIAAWKEEHGVTGRAGVYTLRHATALTQSHEVDRLVGAMKEHAPAMVVIDTLTQNLGDGDENSARDIARLTAGVERIRGATDAAVVLVHHTGLRAQRERGSSALRAAVDTTILVRGNRDGLMKLVCLKQREDEPFQPIHLQLTQRGVSCVLRPAAPTASSGAPLPPSELRALKALAASMPAGLSYSAWGRACELKGGAFDRPAKALVDKELVAGGGGKGVPYVLTAKGLCAVT